MFPKAFDSVSLQLLLTLWTKLFYKSVLTKDPCIPLFNFQKSLDPSPTVRTFISGFVLFCLGFFFCVCFQNLPASSNYIQFAFTKPVSFLYEQAH